MNAIPPTEPRHITIGNITIGNDRPLAVIAGPCALESRAHALEMCQALVEMTAKLGIGLIYKTSFDKANRTSIDGARPDKRKRQWCSGGAGFILRHAGDEACWMVPWPSC